MVANGELRSAVVVTGASSGIGRAIARVAARDGAAIVLVARSAEAEATRRPRCGLQVASRIHSRSTC